jgi:hypothetical protein
MWTNRVLSIIVKHMQIYIVAAVWGVAEVLSLCKSKEGKSSTKRTARVNGESSLVSFVSVAPSAGGIIDSV